MKITDLMVGDWVLDGTQIAQITSITCGGVIETTAHEFSNIEVIEPIPLTDEILRESGFAQHHSYEDGITLEKFVTDGMRIDQLAKVLFVWICPGTDAGILTLHYVHELQHALKLCGIEKEIQL